jgi:glycosidase
MKATLPEDWPYTSVFMWVDIRSCQDSNGDGMGDLPGLISRLDHFQEVGVGALIFPGLQPSDFAYVGTMMTEFCDVDPHYGTLEDFDKLVEEAHKRGIALLPGWSPFSTHPDHPYFQASRDPGHPQHDEYGDYFLWVDDINTRLPRRWGHWEWDPLRNRYYHSVWHSADKRWCPEVNLLSSRAREENERVVRFWLDRGADGFWVDCGVWGSFTTEEDHIRFSTELTDLVHSYPGRKWIISEGSKKIKDTIAVDRYDSLFADQARSVPILKTVFRRPGMGTLVEFFEGQESHGIHEALYSFYDDPKGNQIMNRLRLKTPFDFNDEEHIARTKLSMVLVGTLPLVPSVGFPNHCGLAKEKGRKHVKMFPFLMMWDDSPNFGFTKGTPYVQQNAEGYPASANASAQLKNPQSVLSCFKSIMNLRKKNPALQCRDSVGDSYARTPTSNDDDCYAYVRRDSASGQVMVVVLNLSDRAASFTLQASRSARVTAMISGKKKLSLRAGSIRGELNDGGLDSVTLDLKPLGYAVFEAL